MGSRTLAAFPVGSPHFQKPKLQGELTVLLLLLLKRGEEGVGLERLDPLVLLHLRLPGFGLQHLLERRAPVFDDRIRHARRGEKPAPILVHDVIALLGKGRHVLEAAAETLRRVDRQHAHPAGLDEIHQVKAAEPDIHMTAEDRCVRLAAGIRKIGDLGRIAADRPERTWRPSCDPRCRRSRRQT